MGDRAKGKDKGKFKKKPKAVKPGNRPHERQQQARAILPSAGVSSVGDKDD